MEISLKKYSREEVVEMAYQLGFKYAGGALCPQATFAALQDIFQFRDDKVFESLTGFMGGGGDTCDGACGGVIGGVAALGYLFGRTRTEFDFMVIDLSLRVLVKKIYDQFKETFGGVLCKEVHMKMFGRTFDIFNKDEEKLFLEALKNDKRGGCAYPVAVGSSIAAGVIWDELHNPKRLKDEKYYL